MWTAKSPNFIAVIRKIRPGPDALAALGYGCLIMASALEALAQRPSPKHALGTVGDIDAATGVINMDPEGTPIKSAVILTSQAANGTSY